MTSPVISPVRSPVSSPVRSRVGWVREHRSVLVVAIVLLTAVLVLSILTTGSEPHGDDLDPDNPGANGGQAVARVLADHGVDVRVVRRADALDRARVTADTTLMVSSSDQLGTGSARRLAARADAAGAVVLADPAAVLVRALRLPLERAVADVDGRTAARCADPLLDELELDVDRGPGFRSSGPATLTCFPGAGSRPGALVARVDAPDPDGPRTYAVGATAVFANDDVSRADHAAAALRLLGQRDVLVWYVPDARDVPSGDAGSLTAQLPGGLLPGLVLVLLAALATVLWRGRRLGPLVVEPLPVTVLAVESTQGRGRLYRRVHDRPHTADTLRSATLRRLGARLRLPAGTPSDRVISAVARVTDRDPVALHGLLVSDPVPDDRSLTRLAGDLAALEREVHRT